MHRINFHTLWNGFKKGLQHVELMRFLSVVVNSGDDNQAVYRDP